MTFFKRRQSDEFDATATEEAALLQRARTNPAEFGLLYERYARRIFTYCLRRLGQSEEAEDVTSLVFTRAFAGLDSYRGGSVAAWLFQIAHNAVANHLRSRRPQMSLELAVTNGWAEELAEPGESLLDKLVTGEEHRQVAALIAALPAEQREILTLSVAGGLSAREIGQVLGKSEGAVWTALHRIVKKLQAEYQRQYGTEEAGPR